MKHETQIVIIDITKLNFLSFLLLEKKRGVVFQKKYRGARQNLLLRIDQFLASAKVKLDNLQGWALIEGEGSFSGVRQSVAILNTIALIKGLPAAGFDRRRYASEESVLEAITDFFARSPKVKFLKPIYSGQPNVNLKFKNQN